MKVRSIGLCTAVALSLCAGSAAAEKFALLVGINEYPHWPPERQLKGAVNDANSMNKILVSRYGFSGENIELLINEQATADNVLEAFRRQLIEKATRPGDTALFFYAGHGRNVNDDDGDEAKLDPQDKSDEVLATTEIPYVNNPSSGFVRDDDLGKLISRLKCGFFVGIFDSCMSGTVTRGLGDGTETCRYLPPPLDDHTRGPAPTDFETSGSNSPIDQYGSSGGPARRIDMFACQDYQYSKEYTAAIDNRVHGAFTARLLEVLSTGNERLSIAALDDVFKKPVATNQLPLIQVYPSEIEKEPFLSAEVITSPPAQLPRPQVASLRPLNVYIGTRNSSEEMPSELRDSLSTIVRDHSLQKAALLTNEPQMADVGLLYLNLPPGPAGDPNVVVTRSQRKLTVTRSFPLDYRGLDDGQQEEMKQELRRHCLLKNLEQISNPTVDHVVSMFLTSSNGKNEKIDTYKQTVRLGEGFQIGIRSPVPGFLTILSLDPRGVLQRLIFENGKPPQKRIGADDAKYLRANSPDSKNPYEWLIDDQDAVGEYYFKAFVTPAPINLGTVADAWQSNDSSANQIRAEDWDISIMPKLAKEVGAGGGGDGSFAEGSLRFVVTGK